MPKLKTHSGAKKRFNLTKTGKVKRAHAYKSHILTKKSPKRKRNFRHDTEVASADYKVVARNLGRRSRIRRRIKHASCKAFCSRT